MTLTDVPWESGEWTTTPASSRVEGSDLVVTPRENSDFWQVTSYGFAHDDGHGLLVDLPDGCAVEVSFLADFAEQFDQAGVLVRADATRWVKAGVELADGAPQVGAVVTRGVSDWSAAPFPEWHGREVTVRASRTRDALTVRAKAGGDWHLVRLAPLDPALAWRAGPFCCSPTHGALEVRFTGFAIGPADAVLHG